MPRPAPDLAQRRAEIARRARVVAEAEGWPAVTMRRLAADLGVTQPVLYSAFDGRQAVLDAVALDGFEDLAAVLEATTTDPLARMRAYLEFASTHPRAYEAMFSLPSDLAFATDAPPEPLQRAFDAIAAVFPDADGVRAELAWATLHGLVTLQAGGRLRDRLAAERLIAAHRALTDTRRS